MGWRPTSIREWGEVSEHEAGRVDRLGCGGRGGRHGGNGRAGCGTCSRRTGRRSRFVRPPLRSGRPAGSSSWPTQSPSASSIEHRRADVSGDRRRAFRRQREAHLVRHDGKHRGEFRDELGRNPKVFLETRADGWATSSIDSPSSVVPMSDISTSKSRSEKLATRSEEFTSVAGMTPSPLCSGVRIERSGLQRSTHHVTK